MRESLPTARPEALKPGTLQLPGTALKILRRERERERERSTESGRKKGNEIKNGEKSWGNRKRKRKRKKREREREREKRERESLSEYRYNLASASPPKKGTV